MTVKTFLRKVKNGKSNIYVDYTINRNRKRHKTKLFYYDRPKSQFEKDHNKRTKKLIDRYVAELTLKIQNNELGINKPKSNIKDFIVYFNFLTEHRKETNKNFTTWNCALKHLNDFNPNGLKFSDMNKIWLEQFRFYLTDIVKLKSSSANNYFNVVKHAIHDAFRDRLIDIDFADLVKAPKVEKSIRTYLTEKEVILLDKTDCNIEILKKAFLFSCRTGISYADIKALQWKDIIKDHNNKYYISFNRKKTKGQQHHPISNFAYSMLGRKEDDKEYIFRDLKYNSWMLMQLQRWVYKAGITKTITFHSARHTYATILLHKNTNITLVSKLLGHKDLKTTMIYAKVMDSDLRNASELMNF